MENLRNTTPAPRDLSSFGEDTVFAYYLNDIERYPPISPEVEQELYTHLQLAKEATEVIQDPSFNPTDGDLVDLEEALRMGDEARNLLVLSNTRFVITVAKKWGLYDLMDSIQLGNIGLIRAIDKIDASLNNRVTTYAESWIMQFMKRGILPDKYAVRLPERVVEQMQQIKRYIDNTVGETPSIQSLAEQFHLKPSKVEEYLTLYDILSTSYELDNHQVAQYKAAHPEELLSSNQQGVEQVVINNIISERVTELLSIPGLLTARQKVVLDYIFGLNGDMPMSYSEIGERLGVTKQAVSIVYKTALTRLKEKATQLGLQEYL